MNTLGGIVSNQLRGRVVRVQLDLVDGGDDLGARVIEELLKVLDAEVRDTNVADLAGSRELLHLLPCLDEVPVREVLGCVVGVGAAGPVHEVEVYVGDTQVLQRGLNALRHAVVPRVVQLGGNPDLFAGHTGVLDTLTYFGFVTVGEGAGLVSFVVCIPGRPGLIGDETYVSMWR